MRSANDSTAFIVPKKMKFLISQNIELVVSDLSKVEISRYLKSEWGASKEKIEDIWIRFIIALTLHIS